MLISLRRLERLDKDEFSEEERHEAEEIAEQRKEEEAKVQVKYLLPQVTAYTTGAR